VADGDYILQFGFEDGVEVFGGANGDEGVGVCEGGEDADSVGDARLAGVLYVVHTVCPRRGAIISLHL